MDRPSYFYLLSQKYKYALDIYDGQVKPEANLIVWPQKFEDSDNQLWTYDNGHIINKKSQLVLDIAEGMFSKYRIIVQRKRVEGLATQLWDIKDGFICSQAYPNLVFTIKDNNRKDGAKIILTHRKEVDNLDQLWRKESYGIFESSLIGIGSSGPMHKREDFGKPRLGYGAEVGIPPELTSLPEKTNIAGLGQNVDTNPTPTDNTKGGDGDCDIDPNLPENMPSMYPPSQVQTGYPAQPVPRPSFSNGPPNNYPSYPPSSPPNRYQSPPPQQQYDGYPHSPPPPPQSQGSYPPPPQSQGSYPPPPQSQGSYPPPQQQQYDGYPPASPPPPPPRNQGSYPPPQQQYDGYPPSQPQYPSEANYPPQRPYSPPGPSGPMAGGFYIPPGPGGMPSQNQSQPPSHPYMPPAQNDPYGGYGPAPPLPPKDTQYNNHYNYNYQ
ncbi:hypothetical protein CLU79DRAFT_831169 [Phycomyces nitens]|nr:hypothetical protein CLU79DRAFT_831169 [Phycomyces nitens]